MTLKPHAPMVRPWDRCRVGTQILEQDLYQDLVLISVGKKMDFSWKVKMELNQSVETPNHEPLLFFITELLLFG